jgi:hypothetical protein
VPDHANLDGGQGAHQTYDTWLLRRHRTATSTGGDYEPLIVGLQVGAGEDEPYISIVPRCQEPACQTELTLDEAERVAEYLAVLVRKGRMAIEHGQSVRLLVRAHASQRSASGT